MQVLRCCKYVFLKISVLLLIGAILFSSLPFSAHADDSVPEETYPSSLTNWEDLWVMTPDFYEMAIRAALAGASDIFFGTTGSYANELKNSAWYCSASTEDVAVPFHEWEHTSSWRDGVCKYCGLTWNEFMAEIKEDDSKIVESLDSSTATTSIVVSGYSATSTGSISSYPISSGIGSLAVDSSANTLSIIQSLGINNKVLIVGIGHTSPYYLLGVYFDETGVFRCGRFDNPFGAVNSAYFGVYSLTDLNLVSSDMVALLFSGMNYGGIPIFYNLDYAYSWPYFLNYSCFVFTFDKSILTSSQSSSMPYFYFFFKDYSNSDFSSNLVSAQIYQLTATSGWNVGAYRPRGIVWDNSRIVIAPTTPDGSEAPSRTAPLMGLLAGWNSGNGYFDNYGNINFFLGALNSSGTLDDVYSPAVYDEETLIFTEPVTGAQYQTSGWTYDYNSRSYDIEVESGTFLIGSSDITRIICTYGDDAVTIVYYDASGNVIQSDEFAYVMVSQDPCSLTGHVNSVETKKEATCTSTGERVYTCTVCGNVEVEDIPMKGHSHKYSEIRSPTCTDTGLALYSCSTCGDEVSESLDPLGHDWLATETVETTYTLPDGISCPDCSGTDFISDLDLESETCTCVCNYCGVSWRVNAEVTLGYTVYTCSRCDKTRIEYEGERGDGLFKSIGNFIANGIKWCTEKLKQLVENLQTIVDTFNEYVEIVGQQNSTYPSFLTSVIDSLPADLMAVIWFGVIVFVVVAVIKIWYR